MCHAGTCPTILSHGTSVVPYTKLHVILYYRNYEVVCLAGYSKAVAAPLTAPLPPLQTGAMSLAVSVGIPGTGPVLLIINLLLLICVLFSGFLANQYSMTWALRWILVISPIRCAVCVWGMAWVIH